MKDSYVFYCSWWEAVKELPAEVKAEALEAVMEYALYGIQVQTDNVVVKAVFTLIKPQIDTNNKRYESGCKGGAPAGNNNAAKKQPKNNQKQPMVDFKTTENNHRLNQKQPNDNVYVYDNDNVYDNGEEEENKEEIQPPPPRQQKEVIVNTPIKSMATLDDEIDAMRANVEWTEATRMRFHVRDPSVFEALLQDFRQDCVCRGLQHHDNIRDAMSHFCNWLMKKQEVELEKQRKNEINRRDNCTKQEANRYAIEQLAAAKQRAELGIDDTPKPF